MQMLMLQMEKKEDQLKANTEAAFILPPVLFLYPLKINFLFRAALPERLLQIL